MEFFIIIVLVLVNGVLSMSEMALVSSRKFQLKNAKQKGSQGATTALDLLENPTKFLSTIQIGITLIGILLGVYSGENLTNQLTGFLMKIPFLQSYAHGISVGFVVVFITYLSIVLGELLPKRLGMAFPETIAIVLAVPLKFLSTISLPFVWLLTVSNDFLLKVLQIKKIPTSKITEEEIRAIVRDSAKDGEIQDIEHNIVERVFELGDRKVNSLLTHRTDIVFFNTTDTFETIKEKINQEKHSAYPVCENNNLDNLKGIVLLKDLFIPLLEKSFNILDHLKTPLYFNKNIYAYKVLETFKEKRIHYGIVVDEYGSTVGIVTLDDVVDALMGDMSDSDQYEYQIMQRNENSWLVDGLYPIFEFVRHFDISIETDYSNKFTTLAGLITYTTHTLPEVGDKFIFDNYEFEIVDKDDQRIDKVLITQIDSKPN